jgi:hypothetical protein
VRVRVRVMVRVRVQGKGEGRVALLLLEVGEDACEKVGGFRVQGAGFRVRGVVCGG